MSVSDLISAVENITKISEIHEPQTQDVNFGDAPEWLNKTYLEERLRKYYKDEKLFIDNLDIRPAVARGENYGGVLTRIRTEFITGSGDRRTGHFIVKSSFEEDEFARKIMEPYDIFNREMSIYEQVLPKLNAELLEMGDSEQLFSDTLAVDYDRSVLIFEDLNARDFVMPNRLEGLDMDFAKIVIRKMAKMHATSAVLNEREQGALETYDRGMFNRHTDNYAPLFVGMVEACSRQVAQWKNYEAYAKKLADLVPIYMELGKRVFDIVPGHINVLAHGDLWTNNVLVKYDKATGKPLDAILIDFQYAVWGSPAIDLFYFLNSSLHTEMHFHRQEELIHYYYGVFSEILQKLRYKAPIPSLHNFYLQIEAKSFYGFHTSCMIWPIQRLRETAEADFNALMQTNQRAINFKNECFKNTYCHEIIRHLLPVYERKGLLEVDQ